eukprot:gene30988-38293_t
MAFDDQARKEFYNVLKVDHSINFADEAERARYVEHLHGNEDAMNLLKTEIELCDGQGVFLFSGQSGTGKTTELLRLQHALRTSSSFKGKVFYTDMTEWLNPTQKVELASFMLALTASWVDSLGNEQGQRSAWEKLWSFLKNTDVTLESFSFSAGAAQVEADATAIQVGANFGPLSTNIKLALQNDQQFRSTLEDALKKNKTGFVKQLHDFVRELKIELCPHQEKCVLLIDSLEKIVGGGENTKEVLSSVLQLFEQQSSVLQLPLMHVVYSIPPFILRQNRQLPARLGNAADVSLPSVHVFKRKPYTVDRSEQGGQSKLRRLLSMRYPPWSNFFTEDQINAIIENTGGDIRDYLRTLQLCLLKVSPEQARVTETHIQTAFDRIRPNMDLPEQEKHWLARVNDTHESCLGEHIDVYTLESYIKTKHVLAYMNGCYGLNPMTTQTPQAPYLVFGELQQWWQIHEGFGLSYVFSDDALGMAWLRERVNEGLQSPATEFKLITVDHLQDLESFFLGLQHPSHALPDLGQRQMVWIAPAMDQAHGVLQRLNEMRQLLLRSPHLYLIALPSSSALGAARLASDLWSVRSLVLSAQGQNWRAQRSPSWDQEITGTTTPSADASTPTIKAWCHHHAQWSTLADSSNRSRLSLQMGLQAMADAIALRRFEQAQTIGKQVIQVSQFQQDDLGRANALQALGDLDRRLGQIASARALYTQAIALYEKEQNDLGRANALRALGDLDSRL